MINVSEYDNLCQSKIIYDFDVIFRIFEFQFGRL